MFEMVPLCHTFLFGFGSFTVSVMTSTSFPTKNTTVHCQSTIHDFGVPVLQMLLGLLRSYHSWILWNSKRPQVKYTVRKLPFSTSYLYSCSAILGNSWGTMTRKKWSSVIAIPQRQPQSTLRKMHKTQMAPSCN